MKKPKAIPVSKKRKNQAHYKLSRRNKRLRCSKPRVHVKIIIINLEYIQVSIFQDHSRLQKPTEEREKSLNIISIAS